MSNQCFLQAPIHQLFRKKWVNYVTKLMNRISTTNYCAHFWLAFMGNIDCFSSWNWLINKMLRFALCPCKCTILHTGLDLWFSSKNCRRLWVGSTCRFLSLLHYRFVHFAYKIHLRPKRPGLDSSSFIKHWHRNFDQRGARWCHEHKTAMVQNYPNKVHTGLY